DPVLRKRFVGQPEHVINFFFYVAEEARELMAAMGFRTFAEMIGQMQMLDKRPVVEHWKAKGLDFSKLFFKPDAPAGVNIHKCEPQDHKIHDILDRRLIAQAQDAIEHGRPVRIETTIRNTDRTAGAMLSGVIAKRYDHAGLRPGTIHVKLTGTAGRNFAAGMSGGIAYVLDEDSTFKTRCNLSMVELEPLAEEEDAAERLYHHMHDLESHGRVEVLDDMSRYDVERVHLLITRH